MWYRKHAKIFELNSCGKLFQFKTLIEYKNNTLKNLHIFSLFWLCSQRSQYDEEGDRAALLEEVLSHLSESDQSLTSGQTRSTSRELAGILRNLKKIEHALEGIDYAMMFWRLLSKMFI